MSRQRHVYPTDRIPHLWAHRTQDSARNPQGNLYFDGDTIYSYGRHFPIARHVEHNGRRAVFLNSNDSSRTTNRHRTAVRWAIPPEVQTWYVDNPRDDVKTVIDKQHNELQTIRAGLKACRSVDARAKLYRRLIKTVDCLNKFAECFGYKPKYKTGLTESQTALCRAAIRAVDAEREKRSAAAQRAAETRRNQTWQERERIRAINAIKRRDAMARKNAKAIEAWRNGAAIPHYTLYSFPTMLRIRGESVETSRGAEFPLEHARRALPIVARLLADGGTFQANGRQIRLGHFAIDSIDENGTVRAGCHTVERAEIERLIAQLS